MKQDLVQKLYKIGAIKFGSFTLKSGQVSPVYIDLRLIVSYPELLKMIGEMMGKKMGRKPYDLICGVPYTALPMATALSLKYNIPMVMRRKEKKDYGTKRMLEGSYRKGQNCLVIEDLVTTGSSLLETADLLQEEGLEVTDAIILLDREQGGMEACELRGIRVHHLLKMSELLDILGEQIPQKTRAEVENFLAANQT